jgi:MOSC domain-containing protein YiiM
VENYTFWQKELCRNDLSHGHFGENFTVTDMPDESVHVGDVYRIGEIVTQVTQPRVPCYKLGVKMQSAKFPDVFMQSGRVGFYLRVLREGAVAAGDTIELLQEDPVRLSIKDCMLALVKGPRRYAVIETALQIEALSDSWRRSLSKRLAARDQT